VYRPWEKTILRYLPSDPSFAELVSLACHDLRTPLATAHGFAKTIERLEPGDERAERYIGLIATATLQITDLLDRLALAARIERGAYDPPLQAGDSLELAKAAAELVEVGEVAVAGKGSTVQVDPTWAERSLAAFCVCAIRYGDAERVEVTVHGAEISIAPVTELSAPVLLGEELRDLGAAIARKQVEAVGGSVSVAGESLRIRLATSAAGIAAGP
jgi:signal transduction histidine kinase